MQHWSTRVGPYCGGPVAACGRGHQATDREAWKVERALALDVERTALDVDLAVHEKGSGVKERDRMRKRYLDKSSDRRL